MSDFINDPFSEPRQAGLGGVLERGTRAVALLIPEPALLERGPNTRIDLRFTAEVGYYAPHLVLQGPLQLWSAKLILGALAELPQGPDGRTRLGLDPRPLGFRSPAFPSSFVEGRDGHLFEVVEISATTLAPTLVIDPKTGRQGVSRTSDFVLACIARGRDWGGPKTEPGSPEP